jgi:dTDP-4-dehydrorhamnose 3,5-epimerase
MRRSITVHPDDRGAFAELWRASWTEGLVATSGPARMRQANLSRSVPGVLRGFHLHLHQADLWVVVDGHPFIAFVDLRPPIAGTGDPIAETVEAAPGDAFYLPAGVAHGFLATDPLTLVYLVTNEHDGTDELGFRWDDPASGVRWPTSGPVVSARDASAPSLRELVRQLRS